MSKSMTDTELEALMRATGTEGYPSDVRRLVEAVRNAALEETKDAVLRVGIKYPRVGHQYICGSNDARSDCIDAINALRSKP